ncbi:hypothetical protein tb265_49740 [Gemmatimonadetes bacterium T265]|nr:hypothetical protein tb265_49740 [Gemmatimonadetes bacterium T265]
MRTRERPTSGGVPRVAGRTVRPAADPRRDTLRGIIARAAAPRERSAPCFQYVGGAAADARRARRVAEWERLVAGGAWHSLDALLDARGIDAAAARASLGDVEVVDGALPGWAETLIELFAAPPPTEPDVAPFTLGELADDASLATVGGDPNARWPFDAAFAPFVRRGAAVLDGVLRRRRADIAPSARRHLLAHLARRMSAVGTQVLLHRLTAADVAAGHPGRVGQSVWAAFARADGDSLGTWLALCETYPVLARLLAVAYRQWGVVVDELADRLARDAARLECAFGPAGDAAGGAPAGLGPLVACDAGAGDTHDHGRAVAVLTFASGTRVVYKPKDLRVAGAYMRLLQRLNAGGLQPALGTRRVVHGDGYAWEEFAAAAPCASEAAVRRFYRRLGMHTRLVQLLDGTDFTVDNVVAAGEHPELIDLEMVLSPRLPYAEDGSPSGRAAVDRAGDAPGRGGLITAKIIGEPGRRAAELGALAGAGACVAPFRQRLLRRDADGVTLEERYPEFPPNRATPELDGRPVCPSAFFDDVASGYVAMGAYLAQHAGELGGADGPLAAFATAPVRFLARDTHIYARLLQASLTPHRLRDGVTRELCLERLWRARFAEPRLVQAEVDALRRLDIPMFTARPGTRALYDEDRMVAATLFDAPATEGLAARLVALAARDPVDERAMIDAVLFTLAPDAPRPAQGVEPAATDAGSAGAGAAGAGAAEDDWLAASVAAARAVLDGALPDADGGPAWLGVSYHPWSDSWAFGPLNDDLFSGTAGVGLVLAEVGARADDARLRAAARATLLPIAARLSAFCEQLGTRGSHKPAGAMFGWSGWLYACARGGAALDDAQLRDAAGDALRRLAAPAVADALTASMRQAGAADLASGVAGAALVCSARSVAVLDGAATLSLRCVELLAVMRDAAGRWPADAYPDGARWLRGIPRAEAGAALAFARARPHPPAWVEPVGAASEAAVGDRLATWARASAAGTTHGVGTADAVGFDEVGRDKVGFDGLGPLDAIELALAAHDATESAGQWERAAAHAAALRAAHACRGRWLGRHRIADRYLPSAVVGTAAVAHAFLRIAAGRGSVGALRTLA